MRVFRVCDSAIRLVAVSPDGRFVAAAAEDRTFHVCRWATGERVVRSQEYSPCDQIAFGPNSDWLARGGGGFLRLDPLAPSVSFPADPPGPFAGGVAVAPDGKALLATRPGAADGAKLDLWELPAFRPGHGFDFCSPFRRLAFSPDGEFLAGIWERGFELRFAHTGGLDYRYRPYKDRPFSSVGFVSVTRDSSRCAFGWDSEVHVLDLTTGTGKVALAPAPETRGNPPLHAPEWVRDAQTEYRAPYRAAAFTGSGRHFATVEQPDRWKLWDADARAWRFTGATDKTCLLRLRDVRTWEVVREYDWGCGPLRSLAFTADGSAGVCGTSDGRLVQFDVDE